MVNSSPVSGFRAVSPGGRFDRSGAITVGISPESGRPNIGSTAVAGTSTKSALERRDSVSPWK